MILNFIFDNWQSWFQICPVTTGPKAVTCSLAALTDMGYKLTHQIVWWMQPWSWRAIFNILLTLCHISLILFLFGLLLFGRNTKRSWAWPGLASAQLQNFIKVKKKLEKRFIRARMPKMRRTTLYSLKFRVLRQVCWKDKKILIGRGKKTPRPINVKLWEFASNYWYFYWVEFDLTSFKLSNP